MTDILMAESGIRQLHARFVDAVWRQDADCFADCFAQDGVWKIAGMAIQGREKLGDACRMMLGRCKHIHLIVGLPLLEVGEGTAIGRINMTEFSKMQDDTTAMVIGWYHDRYVDEGGHWRFASRHWSFKYKGPPDLTGEYFDTPDYGVFPNMPGLDEPTYVRPQ